MLSINIAGATSLLLLRGQLSRFAGELRSTRPLLEKIRDEVAIPAVRRNFTPGSSVYNSWAPLSPWTPTFSHRWGNPHAPTLNVRGVLLRSATAKARWEIDGQGQDLFVPSDTFQGSNAIYGRLQHEGGATPLTQTLNTVPGRPFFVFSEGDIARAETMINEWIGERFSLTVGSGAAVGEALR